MYKIIGADQKEYGPVPSDQVRKWIAEGRANAQTKTRAEGGNDWKSLSDFAEFAESLAAQAPAARPSPPKTGALDAGKFAAEIMARDYHVDIGDCFSRSLNLVKDNFWLLVGATALISVISLGMQFIPVLGHAAGVLALVVGVFVTLPIALGATVCAYQDIFGARPTTNESSSPALTPPVPSPAPTAPADAGATAMTQPEVDSTSSAPSPDIGLSP